MVPRCRCYLCRDRLQERDQSPLWYLNGCSVCPLVIDFISSHADLLRSGVAGLLLAHLGDNGNSTRACPLAPLLGVILMIGHMLQPKSSPKLLSQRLLATSLALPMVRPISVPSLSKEGKFGRQITIDSPVNLTSGADVECRLLLYILYGESGFRRNSSPCGKLVFGNLATSSEE
jgi:hypothetical protein